MSNIDEYQYAPLKTGEGTPFPVADYRLPKKMTYQQNMAVKAMYCDIPLSEEQAIEIAKCAKSPFYFIENYCRVITVDGEIKPFELRSYQKEMIDLYEGNRYSVCVLARQMGKTTVVAAYMLWFAMFKPQRNLAILANKESQAIEIMDRIRDMFEMLPFFLQVGIKEYNKKSIVFGHGSEIFCAASSPSAIRGKSCVLGDTLLTIKDKITNNTFQVTMDELEILLNKEIEENDDDKRIDFIF